jgi:hypothetical protein
VDADAGVDVSILYNMVLFFIRCCRSYTGQRVQCCLHWGRSMGGYAAEDMCHQCFDVDGHVTSGRAAGRQSSDGSCQLVSATLVNVQPPGFHFVCNPPPYAHTPRKSHFVMLRIFCLKPTALRSADHAGSTNFFVTIDPTVQKQSPSCLHSRD